MTGFVPKGIVRQPDLPDAFINLENTGRAFGTEVCVKSLRPGFRASTLYRASDALARDRLLAHAQAHATLRRSILGAGMAESCHTACDSQFVDAASNLLL